MTESPSIIPKEKDDSEELLLKEMAKRYHPKITISTDANIAKLLAKEQRMAEVRKDKLNISNVICKYIKLGIAFLENHSDVKKTMTQFIGDYETTIREKNSELHDLRKKMIDLIEECEKFKLEIERTKNELELEKNKHANAI